MLSKMRKRRSQRVQSKLPSSVEFSKILVKYTGIFSACQISSSMILVCLFPKSADPLLSICMTCTAGCMTVFSWYFGKALGENKLKISQGMSSYHVAISNMKASTTTPISSSDSEDEDVVSKNG